MIERYLEEQRHLILHCTLLFLCKLPFNRSAGFFISITTYLFNDDLEIDIDVYVKSNREQRTKRMTLSKWYL